MNLCLKYAALIAALIQPRLVFAQQQHSIYHKLYAQQQSFTQQQSSIISQNSAASHNTAEPLKYRGFILPLEQTCNPQLSSGFGQHRVNRFHSGLDFRTGGVEGVRVRAVADGYIYRIGVKPYGYGNVLYLQHADGVQTIYAHLRNFTPQIEKFAKAERYRLQANVVDLYPPRGKFTVSKGELIGYSGNTGNSSGPHLHFEIRDGAADRTLNPIALGVYDIADTIAPTIFAVSYYVVDSLGGVPFHTKSGKYQAVWNASAGEYELHGKVKAPAAGYFTVETTDRKNGAGFRMPTYRITEKVDGRVRFEYLMDGFVISQNPYARTVAMHAENMASRNDIYRLAVQDGGIGLPFYRNVVERGLIFPERDRQIEIEVADDNGNVSKLRFETEYAPELYRQTELIPVAAEVLNSTRDFTKNSDGLSVLIPAGTLFESILYSHHKLQEPPAIVKSQSGAVISPFYSVHIENVPMSSTYTLSIKADVPEELRSKVLLARVVGHGNGERRLSVTAAKYEDGYVTGQAGSFGLWCVAVDTKPPAIRPAFKSGANLSKARSVDFYISDSFSGVVDYKAEIDGRWVILDFTPTKGRLTHYFDDALTGNGKSHQIKLTVTDRVGNKAVYTGNYFR